MKYVLVVLFFIGFFISPIPNEKPQIKVAKKERILIYSDTRLPDNYLKNRLKQAIIIERMYGVPVKVQIAIDLMESGINKKSKFHNDSWVTCQCNYSKKLRNKHKNSDVCFSAYDSGHKRYFKKYKSITDNWIDKARIISRYKWFKPNQPFEFYSKRLQGTYAESKIYTKSLNAIHSLYLQTIQYDILYQ